MVNVGFLTLPLCAGLLGGYFDMPFLAVAVCLPQAALLGWHYRQWGAIVSGALFFSAWVLLSLLQFTTASQLDVTTSVIGTLMVFLIAWTNAQSRSNVDHAQFHAETDSLTRLLNRHGFSLRLQSEVRRDPEQFNPTTVVFMDCDRFKLLNDTLGHQTGDKLLISAGNVLQASIRHSDCAARLGGDEFTLLLPNTDLQTAQGMLDRLQYRLDALASVHGWNVSWSIGAVTFQSPATPQFMLQTADEAMYEVKRTGKGRVLLREWRDEQSRKTPMASGNPGRI